MVAPVNPRLHADAGATAAAASGRGVAARAAASWLTPAAVARVAGGELLQRGRTAMTVTTDSRGDCTGRLFVALRGANHDGHAFVADAVRQGAVGLLVDRPLLELAGLERTGRRPFVVLVPDTGRALLDLGAEHRRRQRARVVGITGSCGKTSTKEMLGAVLAAAMPTVRSPGSYNNQVGVPLTLFAIEPHTRAAVVEIGTNSPGEIAQLTATARPDVGIVTCVAPAHLAGLGSLDGVAREKAGLPAGLPEDGLCILNGDDAACRAMAEATRARVQLVRIDQPADWFATDVRFHGLGTSFLLQGERPVTLPRLGTHNVYNALAAIAAASHLGVAEEVILRVLAAAPSQARRLEPKCHGGVTIFDDTYNMNPQSARAALQALAGLAAPAEGHPGRRIVVFGEMLELGDQSAALHRALGGDVVRTRQDLLVCVGAGAHAVADGALAAGMAPDAVVSVDDAAAALALLRERLRPGDRVLCKASRRIALDRLVDRLLAELASAADRADGAADAADRTAEGS
jgi:UDP-N-acetylmuramoyl-tripeptide--D-alanyl-D-alanine ligase